jgi:hypothetical protein
LAAAFPKKNVPGFPPFPETFFSICATAGFTAGHLSMLRPVAFFEIGANVGKRKGNIG